MREHQLKQAFKLRLLTVVLALALTWYAINPAPGPVRRIKREGDQPDAKKPNSGSRTSAAPSFLSEHGAQRSAASDALPSRSEEIDGRDWPEFIAID